MAWIHNYQLFLFDFDGLLVNTEELHFIAYKQMLEKRGIPFIWSFERYCKSAHYSSEKLKNDIFNDYPTLKEQEPSWEILYREKQANMQTLLNSKCVDLMPGVEYLLNAIQKAQIKHVVVTHSPSDLITLVKTQHPILSKIPYWITRHDYTHPKPDPECYNRAIKRFCKPNDRIIGFEDTPRGVSALLATRAEAVLITKIPYPEIPEFIKKGVKHFESFEFIDG